MSNYANLKSSIQEVIKTNGRNEITGQLLQTELLAMINTLGYGYQFMGVATTETIPGTPDAKVFYIAYMPGTYTNFGGIVVSGLCVLKYATSWVKEDIPVAGGGGADFLTEPKDLTLETVGDNKVLKFADRPYNSQTPNGLGYKILRGGSTFAEQVTDANTIYEIRYDFEISSNFTMPENCVLRFNGGKIYGSSTLTFNKTKVEGDGSVVCGIAGTLIGAADISNFGANETNDVGVVINKVQSVAKHLIISGSHEFTTPIVISGTHTIEWPGTLSYKGSSQDIDAVTFNGGQCGLYMTGELACDGSGISYSTPTNIRGLVFKNVNSSNIIIGRVQYFNVNIVCIGVGGGCAYNTFILGLIMQANIGILLTQNDEGGKVGYANENLFIGGRISNYSTWDSNDESHAVVAKKIYDGDTYDTINSLVFLKTSVEGYGNNAAFVLSNARGILLTRYRAEGTNTIAKLIGNCKNINWDAGYGSEIVDFSELTNSQTGDTPYMTNVDKSKKYIFDINDYAAGIKQGSRFYPFQLLSIDVYGNTAYYGTYDSVKNTVSKVGVEINFTLSGWHIVTIVLNNSDLSRRNVFVTLKALIDGTTIAAADQQNYPIKFFGSTMSYASGNYWASGGSVSYQTILVPPQIGRMRVMMDNWQVATIITPRDSYITFRQTYKRSGATADRPNQNFCYNGQTFFDETLGKMLVNNGTTWVNMDGSAL